MGTCTGTRKRNQRSRLLASASRLFWVLNYLEGVADGRSLSLLSGVMTSISADSCVAVSGYRLFLNVKGQLSSMFLPQAKQDALWLKPSLTAKVCWPSLTANLHNFFAFFPFRHHNASSGFREQTSDKYKKAVKGRQKSIYFADCNRSLISFTRNTLTWMIISENQRWGNSSKTHTVSAKGIFGL